MIENRATVLACLAIGVLALAMAIFTGSIAAIAIASASCMAAIAGWKYGYMLGALFPSLFPAVKLGEYELAPSQDAIVKRSGGQYYASAFASVVMRPGSPENAARLRSEQFEQALVSMGNVVKISIMARNVNLSKYVDDLKARRSFAESQKSRLGSPSQALEREIEAYNRQLEVLQQGNRPLEIVASLMVTAMEPGREEAVRSARLKLGEACAAFSGVLDAEITRLSGREMLDMFAWETFIPATEEELDDAAF